MTKEEEIINKARELFMAYGLRSITMDDLAKQIGISKKTLYLHFKDKADLVKEIVFSEVERMTKMMDGLFKESENTIDIMMKINNQLVDIRKNTPANVKYDLQKYYPEIAEELKKLMEEKMFEAIKKNHENGKKEGLIRQELDVNVVSALQVCRSNIIDEIVSMLNDYDFEKVLNEIFDYHIRAIATPKGLDYYINKFKKTM
jgi:AcrR family transcriptional regulator